MSPTPRAHVFRPRSRYSHRSAWGSSRNPPSRPRMGRRDNQVNAFTRRIATAFGGARGMRGAQGKRKGLARSRGTRQPSMPLRCRSFERVCAARRPTGCLKRARTDQRRLGHRRCTSSRRHTASRGVCSSRRMLPVQREPVMPKGWPMEMLPPLTLYFSLSMPSLSREYTHCDAKRFVELPKVDVVLAQGRRSRADAEWQRRGRCPFRPARRQRP